MIDYEIFCFTILFEKRKKIISNLGEFFFDRAKLNDLNISTKVTNGTGWINPKSDAMPTFFIGSVDQEEYSVFFSNLPDGWSSAARVLSKKSNCRSIQVRVSNSAKYQVFSYMVVNNGITERIIQLIKEDKWIFFKKGIPLAYEKISVYNSKKIKDRFNSSIIIDYLLEEGISFEDLFNNRFSGVELRTVSWS